MSDLVRSSPVDVIPPRNPRGRYRAWLAAGVLGIVVSAGASLGSGRGMATALQAYEAHPLPAHIDSMTGFEAAASRIEECASGCAGIVYFWSDRMPLSRSGIAEIYGAARNLGIGLTLVRTEEVHAYTSAAPGRVAASIPLADSMLRAGVLAHAPSLVVHAEGRVLSPAILGYKTAGAYQEMIDRRLSAGGTPAPAALPPGLHARPLATVHDVAFTTVDGSPPVADYEVIGLPGAYFRWVPGRQAIAYESRQRIYLLDLVDGRSRLAPGHVDFVPTPDGRYFVTPGPGREGLHFYDADDVFDAARATRRSSVAPFSKDPRMQDQYPSVGILESDEGRTVYRVLTSWFRGIVYRDYEIRVDAGGSPRVRPIGDPVTPCRGAALSIPIMSQDGREVAARDESTGTTKIFRMLPAGRCTEVLDLGVQTSKVAWHRSGRLLAFATPRLSRRSLDAVGASDGIYLFDRDRRRVSKLRDSERASSLAFPDFIGDDSVVFLAPATSRGEANVFRVIDGIR